MRRALLVAALLSLVAGGSAPAKPPLQALLGIENTNGYAWLVSLDPQTLTGADYPAVVLGKPGGAWAFSDDRSQLAYADRSRVRFVAVPAFQRLADLPLRGAGQVAWLDRKIVAVLRGAGPNMLEVVEVDAVAHTVRSRRRFAGVVLEARAHPNALVALLGRTDKIAPVRLLVVQAGRTRVTRLDRVRAGTVWRRGNPPVGTSRIPALALGAAGTAYVADPSGLVAKVPLGTLRPTYRALRGGFAKVVNYSQRRALALGGGLLAITGMDASPAGTRPAGLELVDTRTWRSRLVEPGATEAWASEAGLLVTGSSWDARSRKLTSMGLAVLDRTGGARLRLFGDSYAWVGAVVQSRAYVQVGAQSELAVVDLVSGRVVGRRTAPLPRVLLGRSSSD